LSEVGLYVLPRSLHSAADVRAARTEENVGRSGRDDRKGRRTWIARESRAEDAAGGAGAHFPSQEFA